MTENETGRILKDLHVICHQDGKSWNGLTKTEAKDTYESSAWVVSEEQAEALIGGRILLHRARAQESGFGGTILSFRTVIMEDRERRVFKFLATTDGRGQKWKGANHAMAHLAIADQTN